MLGILGRTGGSRIGLLLSKPEIGEIRDLPRKLHPPRSLVNVGVDLLDASKYFGYSVSTLEARAMKFKDIVIAYFLGVIAGALLGISLVYILQAYARN